MKIVIIGEFSSFAKNLSVGFRQLGHECFVFSWGDGFKKIQQDSKYSYVVNARFHGKGLIGYLKYVINSYLEYLKLKRYVQAMGKKGKWDVVFVMNTDFIKEKYHFWQAHFSKKMIYTLIKNPHNIYLSACGNDVPYFDYWGMHKWKNEDLVNLYSQRYLTPAKIKHHIYCSSFINKVIPISYGYAEAWRNSKYSSNFQVMKTIPLPIDCSKIAFNNSHGKKIVVFHGIIRPIDKGTKYIKEAMEKLQLRYPDMVECRAEGGLPLNDYLELLNRTDILIDQALADAAAMNALYGLAMGKVVVGGNEPLNQKEYGEYDCPVINIGPDITQIYSVLENLVLNRDKIVDLSNRSRKYVERVHDAKKIAQEYINTFIKYNVSEKE